MNMLHDRAGSLKQLVLARRILVLGSSGSGKTTLARALSQSLGIDAIHLDAHFWRTGWVPTPPSEWRQVVARLTKREAWIMDGTYESTLDLRIPASDYMINVDVNRWICLWRIVKRKMTIDDHRRPDAPPGQPIDRAFLRYVWRYPSVTQHHVTKCIRRHGTGRPLVQLKGTAEVRRFLQSVEQIVGLTSTSDCQE